MSVKLLTEHHLEFLSLKGGCTGSSESTLVRLPHCWKSRVAAQLVLNNISSYIGWIVTKLYRNIFGSLLLKMFIKYHSMQYSGCHDKKGGFLVKNY